MARTDAVRPDPSRERYARIRYELDRRGISFAALAKALKRSPSMVGKVAKGTRVSQRVREALARETAIPYEELWG